MAKKKKDIIEGINNLRETATTNTRVRPLTGRQALKQFYRAVNEAGDEPERYRSGVDTVDNTAVSGLIEGRGYTQLEVLRELDRNAYNATAKTKRVDYVSEAELGLTMTNQDGEEEPYTDNQDLLNLVRQAQNQLGIIELSLLILGCAYIYFDAGAKRLIAIPFFQYESNFTISDQNIRKGYGKWRYRSAETGGEVTVDLNPQNSIVIGGNGTLSPQASALAACVLIKTIDDAMERIAKTKTIGIDNIIMLPGDQEAANNFNENMTKKYGGAGRQPGIIAMSSDTARPSDVTIHGINSKAASMPYIEAREAAIRTIAIAYQIPNPLIGDNTATTYNNVKEARISFFEDTIRTEWNIITRELTMGLQRLASMPNNVVVSFAHPTLSPSAGSSDNLLSNVNSMLLVASQNEVRTRLGLPSVEGGDEIPGGKPARS